MGILMSINKKLLKEELLKSPFLSLVEKDLEEGDEIIAIRLVGSTTCGLEIDTSDIDLDIVTIKTWSLDPSFTGEFQSKFLHWWIQPATKLALVWTQPKEKSNLLLSGSFYEPISWADPENLIYVNNKFLPYFEHLQDEYWQQIYKQAVVYNLIKLNEYNIKLLSQQIKCPVNKSFLPLLDFYYTENNLERNTELLKRIKRSLKLDGQKLEDSDWEEIFKAMQWIATWFKTTDYSTIKLLEWYHKTEEILQKCQKNIN